MSTTHSERFAAYERITRRVRTATTYLRSAGRMLSVSKNDFGAVPADYWTLLDVAIETATDIVENLPDDFFATTHAVSIFDGEPFKHNLSDDAREGAEKLVAAINKRLEKVTKLSVIERLEAVEGRTPEEAALYLDKARELRETL